MITGRSRPASELYVRRPTPGRPNTTSTSSAPPPTSAPKSRPKRLTNVIIEVRSMCRVSTRPLGEALRARRAHEVLALRLDAGAERSTRA